MRRCSLRMATRHSEAGQIVHFLGVMAEVFKKDFNYVLPLVAFGSVVFRMAGVPKTPAIIIGLCIGCGMVALLTASSEKS